MNQITNSNVKEKMRKKNEEVARNRECQIKKNLNTDLNQFQYKERHTTKLLWGLMISFGLGFELVVAAGVNEVDVSGVGLIYFMWGGLIVGVLVAGGIYLFLNYRVNQYNDEIDNHILQLKESAENDIRKAYREADNKTRSEMIEYDNEVKRNSQKILQNPTVIETMVDHVVMMFQRMVSHADASSNMKFVETDFIFEVSKTEISFKYNSTYTNPRDDYNFSKERYRDLKTDEECEGLAEALAKLTILKMRGMYPPDSLNITVSHNDALVTLHFKAANRNFIAARDIL